MNFQFPKKGAWSRLPTPVQKLERLSSELGIGLWVKRDDLTGFELAGNKIRKLDFLVADALEKGANTLITCGGVQSNHCRATAALAARLGLRCVLLLRGEKPPSSRANFFLDQLFGAETFFLTSEQYYEGMAELRLSMEEQIRSIGGKAYFIPEGGTGGLGSFGYADAFLELEKQRKAGEIPGLEGAFDSIVVANGSGGTQAGLVLGKLLGGKETEDQKILGVNVCYDEKETFRRTKDALWQAIQQYHIPLSFLSEDIEVLPGYLGKGYALSRPEELAFVRRIAGLEGLLVDPVYTGKALFGLYTEAKKNPGRFGRNVLFLHTGGAFGLFRSETEWEEILK
jgi:D-cysteine desulfhydrase